MLALATFALATMSLGPSGPALLIARLACALLLFGLMYLATAHPALFIIRDTPGLVKLALPAAVSTLAALASLVLFMSLARFGWLSSGCSGGCGSWGVISLDQILAALFGLLGFLNWLQVFFFSILHDSYTCLCTLAKTIGVAPRIDLFEQFLFGHMRASTSTSTGSCALACQHVLINIMHKLEVILCQLISPSNLLRTIFSLLVGRNLVAWVLCEEPGGLPGGTWEVVGRHLNLDTVCEGCGESTYK